MVSNVWIKEQLQMLSEDKFRDFTMRLMPGVENVYGVRLPILRKSQRRL